MTFCSCRRLLLLSLMMLTVPLSARAEDTRSPEDRSLQAMIGQMILIGFPGTDPGQEWPARVAGMVREGRIGGVVLFSDNVKNPQQVKTLIASLTAAAQDRPRPFICVDQEGGAVERLTRAKGFIGLPSAARIGQMNDDAAYSAYLNAARELADLGFNVNFGPVVDLDVNPDSPAIGRLGRSYDKDPAKVIEFARQFINAHDQAGILTAIKHFPGHGSATADSHDGIVDISNTWQTAELDPYRALIDSDFVHMVLVGHLIHPRFSDAGNLPASLSRRAIQGELRGTLGFQGIVVSDDLNMGAIRDRYSVEQAAVLAIAAGTDLIIVSSHKPPDPAVVDGITAAILKAIADGRISVGQIEDAYRLIVSVKSNLVQPQCMNNVGRRRSPREEPHAC
jgi:beta-N-acetylhexosaminidase